MAGLTWEFIHANGHDFVSIYYLAQMLIIGKNAYSFNVQHLEIPNYARYTYDPFAAIFYSPSTGIAILPLGFLSYRLAAIAWYALLSASLVMGIWQFTKVVAPKWDSGIRLLIIAFIVCSSSIRTAYWLLQFSPLMLGLFGLYFSALVSKKSGFAAIWGALILILKPTFGLPVIGFSLLGRRYRLTAVILGIWLVINAIGFIRLGGEPAFKDYRANMAMLELLPVNNPNPYSNRSAERLDLTYLLNGFSPNNLRSHLLAI